MKRTSERAGIAMLGICACVTSAAATTYKYTTFDAPGASFTMAFGINDAGQFVGGAGSVGFLDTAGTFSTISVPGSRSTQASAICDIGSIAGFYKDASGLHGFVKTTDTYSSLDYPGATMTLAFGINITGQAVGVYVSNGTYYGYRYSDGVYTSIAVSDAVTGVNKGSQAHGINKLGQIVGFFGQGVDPVTKRNRVSGFLDSGGKITTFAVPGAYATEADGINDHGDIVGTYGLPSGEGFGFVYSHGAFATLAVPNASKTEAQSINNAGQVVGWTVIDGKFHGFVATPTSDKAEH